MIIQSSVKDFEKNLESQKDGVLGIRNQGFRNVLSCFFCDVLCDIIDEYSAISLNYSFVTAPGKTSSEWQRIDFSDDGDTSVNICLCPRRKSYCVVRSKLKGIEKYFFPNFNMIQFFNKFLEIHGSLFSAEDGTFFKDHGIYDSCLVLNPHVFECRVAGVISSVVEVPSHAIDQLKILIACFKTLIDTALRILG